MKRQDITGQKFGKLTVIKRLGLNSSGHSIYLCQCECGNYTKVSRPNLKSGGTKSCGCLLKHSEKRHGLSNTPLYNSWRDMKIRCYNENSPSYINYGARGIKVCEEWLNDFMTFYKWAMANGYKKGLSIDRIDVNGDYEPNNCKWATKKEQGNNKRNNVKITYNNETHTLSEWVEITGINRGTLNSRLQGGKPLEEVFAEVITRTKHFITSETELENEIVNKFKELYKLSITHNVLKSLLKVINTCLNRFKQ